MRAEEHTITIYQPALHEAKTSRMSCNACAGFGAGMVLEGTRWIPCPACRSGGKS